MEPPKSLPEQLLDAYVDWTNEVAWEGERTTTWRLTSPDARMAYAKVGSTGIYPTLADERDRLVWCSRWTTVPEVLDYDEDGELAWIVTAPLAGVDATIEKLRSDPAWLVPLLGAGLRAFHDTMPVGECPFDFRLDTALDHCALRVSDETTAWDGLRGRNDRLTPAQALAELRRSRPASEDVVVCHGDYCFPNVFIADGRITGYLDVGELGLADRWWDIAIGAWSTTWNVDPKWEPLFYEGYGIEPDPGRIAYYRLLYEVAG
jgi:kanamycin kinase